MPTLLMKQLAVLSKRTRHVVPQISQLKQGDSGGTFAFLASEFIRPILMGICYFPVDPCFY